MKEFGTIRMLLPLLRNHSWELTAVVLLGIISFLAEGVGLSLFMPLLQSLDPNTGAAASLGFLSRIPASDRLAWIVGCILAMTVLKGLLTYTHSTVAARMNMRVTHGIRSRMFSKLIGLNQERLEQAGSGRLINLLSIDTWHASDAISLCIGLVVNLCSILVFSMLLVWLSWKLTIVVAAGVLAISLALQAISRSARGLGQQGVAANAVLSQHMLDGLEGVREIQMFNLRDHRQKLFDAISEQVGSIYRKLDVLHRGMAPVSEILYVGLLLTLLLIGVMGHMSIPSLMVYLLVLYRLQPQIRLLDSSRLSLAALSGTVEEVTRFLLSRDEATPAPGTREIPVTASTGDLEFDAVSFWYEQEREFSIAGLSLRIPLGRTTAIVGASGSGKTTLVSLLCRFYEPRSGEIRVNGQSIHDFDLDQWRREIAWVSQDAYLFSGSVAENIRYGRLDATDEEIRLAAEQADASGFIGRLPDGFETQVGNGGVSLSSGQVQRIALARALVRKARILILDEATNAIDSVSEDWIQHSLRTMAGGVTVIVISHRLSSVKHADHVIVLENGAVAQQGEPREVIAAGSHGYYSKLRTLQHVD